MNAIANKSSVKEFPTVFWMPRLSSEISENSSPKDMPNSIMEWLMSLQAVSPASLLVSQEKDSGKQIHATCGQRPLKCFALLGQDMPSSRMSPDSCKRPTLEQYSGKLPKAGMIADGACWELPTLEQIIGENGSGYWPTPQAAGKPSGENEETWLKRQADGKVSTPPLSLAVKMQNWPTPASRNYRGRHAPGSKSFEQRKRHPRGVNLVEELQRREEAERHWPTPMSRDFRTGDRPESRRARNVTRKHTPQLNDVVAPGGQLNPPWVEWLMGWPIGWTDLKPLETDKFLSAWLEPFRFYLKELSK